MTIPGPTGREVPGAARTIRHRRWAAPPLLALAILGLGGDGPPPDRDGADPPRGSIDLRIDDPADPRRRSLRVNGPGALPLRAGDRFRIEVRLDRPAYLYVFWIGSDGKVGAIFPWARGDWSLRPDRERKVDRLDLPTGAGEAWEVPPGPPGLETLVLLVRREAPLPRDIDLARQLAGPSSAARLPLSDAVRLEDGREVPLGPRDRGVPGLKARKSDDPILKIRRRLRDAVQPLGDATRALIVPNRGG